MLCELYRTEPFVLSYKPIPCLWVFIVIIGILGDSV